MTREAFHRSLEQKKYCLFLMSHSNISCILFSSGNLCFDMSKNTSYNVLLKIVLMIT